MRGLLPASPCRGVQTLIVLKYDVGRNCLSCHKWAQFGCNRGNTLWIVSTLQTNLALHVGTT